MRTYDRTRRTWGPAEVRLAHRRDHAGDSEHRSRQDRSVQGDMCAISIGVRLLVRSQITRLRGEHVHMPQGMDALALPPL